LERSGETYKFYRPSETTSEVFLYGFDAKGLMLLASINTAYLGLLDLEAEYLKQIQSLKKETGLLEVKLQLKSKNAGEYKLLYEIAEINNQTLKATVKSEREKFTKIQRKEKFKIIFISTGVGVVGLSVGLILGAFLL
jgi:hypothetical protein